jgi:hypothetical protein
MGYREFVDLLLGEELGLREGRRLRTALKLSGLPHHKTLEEFDFGEVGRSSRCPAELIRRRAGRGDGDADLGGGADSVEPQHSPGLGHHPDPGAVGPDTWVQPGDSRTTKALLSAKRYGPDKSHPRRSGAPFVIHHSHVGQASTKGPGLGGARSRCRSDGIVGPIGKCAGRR